MNKLILTVLLTCIFCLCTYAEEKSLGEPNLKTVFIELSKKLIPTVVNIHTSQTISKQSLFGNNENYRRFFEEFFGVPPHGRMIPGLPGTPRKQTRTSLGSGFIIDAEKGLILTNNHVVDKADDIRVMLSSFSENQEGIPAKLIGNDEEADIALIKIKTKNKLTAVPLGDSGAVEIGEWVMAIGNPFGHGHTVTKGIISAKERVFPIMSAFSNYLQTDTPINPGNSGGPLINLKGEVIGVNTFINAYAQGIGFALPINYIKRILPELRTKGSITRGYIGANISELTKEFKQSLGLKESIEGVMVAQVMEGEAALKAGVKAYDIITHVNNKLIRNTRELIRTISGYRPGKKITLKILRQNKPGRWKKRTVGLIVGKRPKSFAVQPSPLPKYKIDVGMQLSNLDQSITRSQNIPKDTTGVMITGIQTGGPAESAGLRRGDIIVEVNQKKIKSVTDFFRIVDSKRVYLIRFMRKGNYSLTSLDLQK